MARRGRAACRGRLLVQVAGTCRPGTIGEGSGVVLNAGWHRVQSSKQHRRCSWRASEAAAECFLYFGDGLQFLDHGVEHEGERLIRGQRRRLAFGPGLGFFSAENAEILRSQSSFLGGEVPGTVSCAPPCGLVRRHRGMTRRAEGAGNSSLRSQNLGVLCAESGRAGSTGGARGGRPRRPPNGSFL
jgi:hypothetical protein